ncbi:MAG: CoA-binding protein, partial [Dehalococcoidales bacterium]|nr:CoA-binding protein [Dehalococcoidales bacterium]
MADKIKAFFEPSSVAIIGATDNAGSVGRTVLENLIVSKDTRHLYPVNPKKEELLGIKAYPSVSELPETPDLAIIIIKAEQVASLVNECGKKGITSIIIISAGFKEVGAEGKKREEEIAEIAHKYGIRIIGPNCLGVIRPSSNLNATFARKS